MVSREYIPYTDGCFACGDENERGMKIKLYEENGKIEGTITIDEHLKGYAGMAHGGIICALLDEVMIWAAVMFGAKKTMYITTDIQVKYLAPVPTAHQVKVSGWVVEEKGKIAFCEGEVVREEKTLATSKGKFLAMGEDRLKEIYPHLRFGRCTRFRDFFKHGEESKI